MNKKVHIFHIINPAPWPFLLTISLFNVIFNIILWLNRYEVSEIIFVYSILILVICIQGWFLDVTREASFEGMHASLVQYGLKMGMILFLVSEIMFFFAFFWGYFHYFLAPSLEIGAIWPPYGIQVFNYLQIPLYNTFVLLFSAVTVTWCHHEMVTGSSKLEKRIFALILTILLALHFTYWQFKEYIMSSFNITDSIYGGVFFMATGFHGFHVIIGTLFLLMCFFRLVNLHFTKQHHIGMEFAIWYWHFVDVVWLLLYILIYFQSSSFI